MIFYCDAEALKVVRIYRCHPVFGMPPLLLPGLEPASPGTPTVLTRVRCLSLKQDTDREVRSHPDSRISAKVQSWELSLSRLLRPDNHRNHPELRHGSSLHFRLRHQKLSHIRPWPRKVEYKDKLNEANNPELGSWHSQISGKGIWGCLYSQLCSVSRQWVD